MTRTSAERIVFWSALYDLVVTWPFATPWTASLAVSALAQAHEQLGLGGAPPSVADPTALLFANLLGSIVTVWSVVRLARPTAWLGLADTVGRALFSSWMVFAVLHGGSATLLAFLVPEVAWGLAQGTVVGLALCRSATPWTPRTA